VTRIVDRLFQISGSGSDREPKKNKTNVPLRIQELSQIFVKRSMDIVWCNIAELLLEDFLFFYTFKSLVKFSKWNKTSHI
jgi:hypothetical protein